MDSFGKRLKYLRTERELTQAELGKTLNVTYVAVSKWESDDRFPDKELLVKIADYFEVTIDYLLCRTDDQNVKVYKANIDGENLEIGINKNYPHDLKPDEVEKLLRQLKEVGFDVNKLIDNAKQEP